MKNKILKLCVIVLILSVIILGVMNTEKFVNSNQSNTTTPPIPTTTSSSTPLILTLISTSINGCSQVGNINATWIGNGYYNIDPSNFHLIIKTPNAIYSNSTDVIQPNNIVSWYLFQNVPITVKLSFFSCTLISNEHLVYTDGQFTITIA